MKRIFVIEDDPTITKGLKTALEEENYDVVAEEDGEAAYEKCLKDQFDLIILDLILPGKDGLSICHDLRKEGINTPILMLTAKKEEIDKVLGLEIGADDYVTKPFSLRELTARVKSILRRTEEFHKQISFFEFNNLKIDFKKMEAWRNDILIDLSSTEFKILKYFIERKGEVVSRDQLLDEVWGYEVFPTTRTVDNYILSLRKKIEDDPSEPKHLLTIYKAGYKFVE